MRPAARIACIAAGLTLCLAFALTSTPTTSAGAADQPKTKAAQTKKARSGRSAAPSIAYVFPAGGARTARVQATVTGTNLKTSTDVRVSGGGVSGKIVGEPSATSAKIELEVAADAELGERDLRLLGPGGVSNRYRFFVGDHREILEAEPNALATPQSLGDLPVVVNGQITETDRDVFRFQAKAGQTLVFDVSARRVKPFIADAVPAWLESSLVLYGPGNRKIVEAADFRFRPDPLLIHRVEADGEYAIEIRDELTRGRGDFVYRLDVGELPRITHAFPLGVRRGESTTLELFGANLPESTFTLNVPPDAPSRIEIVRENRGLHSNALPIAVCDWPATAERESSNAPPQEVAIPTAVDGRIDRPGDVDRFLVAVPPDRRRLLFEIQARRFESPLDALLTIFDEKGNVVAENDDEIDARLPLLTHQADPRLIRDLSPGKYVVQVRDAQLAGGDSYGYRLLIGPPQPDYSLRVTPDNLRMGPGETVVVNVDALRLDGHAAEIAIDVQGLPPGFSASDATLAPGQNQAALTITAPAGATPGVCTPRIVGTANEGGKSVVRTADAAETVMQAFTWSHTIPCREYSLAIVEAPEPLFALTADRPAEGSIQLPAGGEVEVKVKVVRGPEVPGPVALTALGLPPGVTAKPGLIDADKSEGVLTLTAALRVKAGLRQNVVIRGSIRTTGRNSVTQVVPAIPFVVAPAKTP
ncbi:COG1470 family protein [Paludisphaera rhizosphaerae]|uniref:COG1470 family protein n=1 Tax=Paludisphaera rhizosphaerae TaxID=2711216 RepID=UPI0013EB71EB|nr:hypothetical protein [Paludisphaera rhizosphaerae]